ncbi:DNA methyltransferase [Populibacterium corticicola]|uniref:DNA methyltransferase n=1 Tax=Populibacterium corticicola TaxID=1812826 RepID=A0ABW5XFV2_9MICO
MDGHDALANTGSVWVHLDDNEHHTARTLLDGVFGADQFVANVVWERKKKPSYLHGHVAAVVDHILVYAKDHTQLPKFTMPGSATTSRVPLAQGKNPVRTLTFPPGSVQLPGTDRTIPAGDQSTPSVHIHLDDDIVVCAGVNATGFSLTGELRWTQATLNEHLAGGVQLRAPKLPLRVNAYVPSDGKTWTNLWTRATGMATNEDAREHQRTLFGHHGFDTPKPEELLGRIIETATKPGDLVIDPFGGSGTTAAAAHKLGRNWMTVESNADTVRDYIIPRMDQVVDGSDRGGISTRPADTTVKLPPAFTPRDARLAAQWVRDLAGSGAFDVEASSVIDVLKQASRGSERIDTWRGGGIFQVIESAASRKR